jgi:hypothetical protein
MTTEETEAVRTVRTWLDGCTEVDYDKMRSVFDPDGVVYVFGDVYRGQDAVIDWYKGWRGELDDLPGFDYEYTQFLPGNDSAAVIIKLWDDEHTWYQVGTYHVRDGKITELWGYE